MMASIWDIRVWIGFLIFKLMTFCCVVTHRQVGKITLLEYMVPNGGKHATKVLISTKNFQLRRDLTLLLRPSCKHNMDNQKVYTY